METPSRSGGFRALPRPIRSLSPVPSAVDNLAILGDRPVQARAPLRIGNAERLRHLVGVFTAVLQRLETQRAPVPIAVLRALRLVAELALCNVGAMPTLGVRQDDRLGTEIQAVVLTWLETQACPVHVRVLRTLLRCHLLVRVDISTAVVIFRDFLHSCLRPQSCRAPARRRLPYSR